MGSKGEKDPAAMASLDSSLENIFEGLDKDSDMLKLKQALSQNDTILKYVIDISTINYCA